MSDFSEFDPLFQETPETIRSRLDADINAGLDTDDPAYVDTREGSFYYDVTQVLVLEFARLWDALSLEVPASAFPIFSWGSYLDDHAAVFDLTRKAATPAGGDVLFVGEPATYVPVGTVVSADAPTEDGEAIEFATTEDGTTGAQVAAPGTVTPTGSTSSGTLTAGTYYYVVTATNEFGETIASPVAGPTTIASAGHIALDWADVTDADAYRVYRGTASTGPFYRLASPTPSTYTDDGSDFIGAVQPPALNSTAGVSLGVEAVIPGTDGNLSAAAITNIEGLIVGLETVTNPLATSGGTDTESDEALRERILNEFESRGAGSIGDYRRWALAYPGVGRVYVEAAWAGGGTVLVVIMDADGNALPSDIVDGLQTLLDPTGGTADGEAPAGVTVTVDTPDIVAITVAAAITFVAGFNLDGGGGSTGLRTEIEEALANYINNLDVGEDVSYEHVKAQFYAVPGVQSVASVTVNGGTSNVSITSSPAQTAQLTTATLS